eukprot:1771450-Pleurochrysis_carterae.AAC.4
MPARCGAAARLCVVTRSHAGASVLHGDERERARRSICMCVCNSMPIRTSACTHGDSRASAGADGGV